MHISPRTLFRVDEWVFSGWWGMQRGPWRCLCQRSSVQTDRDCLLDLVVFFDRCTINWVTTEPSFLQGSQVQCRLENAQLKSKMLEGVAILGEDPLTFSILSFQKFWLRNMDVFNSFWQLVLLFFFFPSHPGCLRFSLKDMGGSNLRWQTNCNKLLVFSMT